MDISINALARLLNRKKAAAPANVERVKGIFLQEQSFGPVLQQSRKELELRRIMEEIQGSGCRKSGAGQTGFVP